MTAIFLVWNPDRWNDWNYASVIEQVSDAGQAHGEWPVGGRTGIAAGADAWLLLKGRHGPGLLGHGVVVRAQPGAAPPDATATTSSALIAFDSLLPRGDQIGPEVLSAAFPELTWNMVRNGQAIEESVHARIRELWRLEGPAPAPGSTLPVPGTYPAWAVSKVEVNRYERDPAARRACIAHYGTLCAACGFSFEIAYGDAGRDFIDVHHTAPVSLLDSSYRLDPVTDLVPLCANCHAMAHLGVTTPRTLSVLRQMLAGAGFMHGQTVRPEELASQAEALRILGPAEAGPGHGA
ncbi:HNH endonuclease [Arthrobacter sp. SPG23]|uniref:HNH endonuclease n=1 Tax=Arthrobacter sp. SPG23 TaxID=1610703 RepID=UPI0005B83F9F|nr:HNH endonuclease [Arthrobacter sp. SPG23]KIS27066.1 HNH endonuclease [Arthrobacter sp. SPG23]